MKIKCGIILLMVLSTIFVVACVKESEQLSELQITACNSADEANTCDTRLADLDLVTKEQCCKILGKCCGGN